MGQIIYPVNDQIKIKEFYVLNKDFSDSIKLVYD